MSRTKIQEFAFLATLVLVTAAFLWLPSYGAILWAAILDRGDMVRIQTRLIRKITG